MIASQWSELAVHDSHQEIIWVVRWRVQQTVLGEAREELEVVEASKTSRRGEGETDCGQ